MIITVLLLLSYLVIRDSWTLKFFSKRHWNRRNYKIRDGTLFSHSHNCLGECTCSLFSKQWSSTAQTFFLINILCVYVFIWVRCIDLCGVSMETPSVAGFTCCASPSCLKLASVALSAWQAASAWLKFILYFPSGERRWNTPAVLADKQ